MLFLVELQSPAGENPAMQLSRFFLPAGDWDQDPHLAGDEAKHLTQVLRLRAGDRIAVFDGQGRRGTAVVRQAHKQRVEVQLLEVTSSVAVRPRITLAQAVPKGKNMDWIVQKAVELGVAGIQPLLTRHSVALPRDEKAQKWQRTALEACKQCGQDRIPHVAETLPFAAWLAQLPTAEPTELRLIASLAPGALPLRDVMRQQPAVQSAVVLIGPEGDFADDETSAALEAGFLPVTLGDIVLRVETAALFCLSALRCEYA